MEVKSIMTECYICDTKVLIGTKVCPRCKHELQWRIPSDESMYCLDDQEPRKEVNERYQRGDCPICLETVKYDNNFCPRCGQKIKWKCRKEWPYSPYDWLDFEESIIRAQRWGRLPEVLHHMHTRDFEIYKEYMKERPAKPGEEL